MLAFVSVLPGCLGEQWQGSQVNEREDFYGSGPAPTSSDCVGRLFRKIIQQNPSNSLLHVPGYSQLFILLCFSWGWFPASQPPSPGVLHRDVSPSTGAKGETWELMEGDHQSKPGYSELHYIPSCLNINIQKASESVNNLHTIYHAVFGTENKASIVDSFTHLNLIRILMLIWQHHVAKVTPLTLVEILMSFIWSKGSEQGEPMAVQGWQSLLPVQSSLLCWDSFSAVSI